MKSTEIILPVFQHAIVITVFVFVMMLLIDYINVITNGKMSHALKGGVSRQYLISSVLGSTPGCLGAFLNVSFYIHGLLSFGAIVGSMIATSGDEAFVMLSLFPKEALMLFGLLFIFGIVLGWLTDKIAPLLKIVPCKECKLQEVHEVESCNCFDKQHLARYYLRISRERMILLFALVIILLLMSLEVFGPSEWNWKRITLVILTSITIVIVGSVPDHFIRDHIWNHIVKKHLLRVFIWTFSALLIVEIALEFWNVEEFIKSNMVWVLVVAVLLGVIPESGPHMVIVMMFAEGVIPFSVLLASSIAQDGHGMLPLFSYTLKDSLMIKAFNLSYGLIIGFIFYFIGI
ncbi:MAG: putative manganese transporter [Bacteroidales bacterium]